MKHKYATRKNPRTGKDECRCVLCGGLMWDFATQSRSKLKSCRGDGPKTADRERKKSNALYGKST